MQFDITRIKKDLHGMSETEINIYLIECQNDFDKQRLTQKQLNEIYAIADKELAIRIPRKKYYEWIKLLHQSGIGSKMIVLKEMEEMLK